MMKKAGLTIASMFLIWQSYSLLMVINNIEINAWGLIFFISWLLNLFITGIFALSGFAFPTQKTLPNRYYKIHHPKNLIKVYNLLKVNIFRQMLLATLWKNKQQRKKYFNGKKEGILNLEEHSKKSEFGHAIPFVILCIISIYFFVVGLTKIAACTLLINCIGNFYPIILQRHHRMRIEAITIRHKN